MPNYKLFNEQGIPVDVIVADEDFIATLDGDWRLDDGTLPPIRDQIICEVTGALIDPQPHPSWVRDYNTDGWVPPIPYPDDIKTVAYDWDEENQQFIVATDI